MDIEKLNELQKCLEILRMDDFMEDKDFYTELILSVIDGSVTPLIKSLQQEDDTNSKLFKFLTKLDKNLKAIITIKKRIEDNKKFYQHRRIIQQWIKYYENGLKDILAEYE
jgi:hypothetical protein